MSKIWDVVLSESFFPKVVSGEITALCLKGVNPEPGDQLHIQLMNQDKELTGADTVVKVLSVDDSDTLNTPKGYKWVFFQSEYARLERRLLQVVRGKELNKEVLIIDALNALERWESRNGRVI